MDKKINKISDLQVGSEYYIAFGETFIKKMKLLGIINEEEIESNETELYVGDKDGTNLLYFSEIGIGTTRQEAKRNYGKFQYENNPNFSNSFKEVYNNQKQKNMKTEDITLQTLNRLKEELQLYPMGFRSPNIHDGWTDQELHEVKACFEIIQYWGQRKQLNRELSSYGLKHEIERFLSTKHGKTQYISNGSLIAAMILCDFQYRRVHPYSPNAYFNVRTTDINYLREKEREIMINNK